MARKRKGRLSHRNKLLSRSYGENKKTIIPHSFVIHRGKVGMNVRRLVRDIRKVMEPNTAVQLKESKKNSIKDFVSVTGPLNVTHIIIFTRTEVGIYMKLCRVPRGPTLVFKIESYCLTRDVVNSLKRQMTETKQYQVAPCFMTNLQPKEGEKHLQLSARMFLDLFPTINPTQANLKSIKRCCIINYDQDLDLFDFRHYSVRVIPVEISKAMKKIIGKRNRLPDLSRFHDVSEFVQKAGLLSESEAEDDPSACITVEKKFSKTKTGRQKSSVRLTELGPRLTMRLIKIEEGLLGGNILYHSIIQKTDEEKRQLIKKLAEKKRLKLMRKKQQDMFVAKKKEKKYQHKKQCLAGMNIEENDVEVKDQDGNEDEDGWVDMNVNEDDDEAKYYEDEVGMVPDEGMFCAPKKPMKRPAESAKSQFIKKPRGDEGDRKVAYKDRKQNIPAKKVLNEQGEEKAPYKRRKPETAGEKMLAYKKKKDKIKLKKRVKAKSKSRMNKKS